MRRSIRKKTLLKIIKRKHCYGNCVINCNMIHLTKRELKPFYTNYQDNNSDQTMELKLLLSLQQIQENNDSDDISSNLSSKSDNNITFETESYDKSIFEK